MVGRSLDSDRLVRWQLDGLGLDWRELGHRHRSHGCALVSGPLVSSPLELIVLVRGSLVGRALVGRPLVRRVLGLIEPIRSRAAPGRG